MPRSEDLPYPPFELTNRVLAAPPDFDDHLALYEMFGASTKEMLLDLLPDGYSLRVGGRSTSGAARAARSAIS